VGLVLQAVQPILTGVDFDLTGTEGSPMSALAAIIASLITVQAAPTENFSQTALGVPVSDAELASATASNNSDARQLTAKLSLVAPGRSPMPSVVASVSNTDPQSVGQAETVLNLQITLRTR
jgi:hypothetical protein